MINSLVSIIVPVYNLEDYIQHTLDTIFAQTHKELEVIAIDDGSTDASPAILDKYAQKEPRLKVAHQQNAGVSAARNAGLAIATGDYIGFCDGDDEMEPTMIERLLANLVKYDADISHCGMLTVGLNGQISYFHNSGTLELHSHEQGLMELLSGNRIEPSLCNKLYKKELFSDITFDSSISVNEDLLINVILFQRAEKTVFEDICLYHYVKRGTSASNNMTNIKQLLQLINVREKIKKIVVIENDSIKQYAESSYLLMHISAYTLSYRLQNQEGQQFRSQIRQKIIKNRHLIYSLHFSSKIHMWLIIVVPWVCDFAVHAIRFCGLRKKYG